ncbi:MAG: SH3 domain-containing protein [Clostridiales bacterium]|nr:SH3 domain-containing protein [Clostridiales bacterium]
MNRKTFTLRLTAIMLTAVIGASIAACGGKDTAESLEASDASAEISSITTTTEATTTLTEYTGPLANTEPVTWNETALESETVLYVYNISDTGYLNVRTGPQPTYAKAGTLSKGQSVTVVARTDNDWYKTSDGFYISGNYLTSTPPTA